MCFDKCMPRLLVFRGWSNTVGNLNEGFRVTKEIHCVFVYFFGGSDWTHACAHFAFHFWSLTFSTTHMFKFPCWSDVATHDTVVPLALASTTNKQVCWAPHQVFAHINSIFVSHGAQPWPWPMSFLGARRGHFWVSTRPFQKFNEKSFLTTVLHFGSFFVQREIARRVLIMSRISTRKLFEPHRVIVWAFSGRLGGAFLSLL